MGDPGRQDLGSLWQETIRQTPSLFKLYPERSKPGLLLGSKHVDMIPTFGIGVSVWSREAGPGSVRRFLFFGPWALRRLRGLSRRFGNFACTPLTCMRTLEIPNDR